MSLEFTSGRAFPFSKPLAFLIALTAIYTLGLSVIAVHAVVPTPERAGALWSIAFALNVTWWVYADKGARPFKWPFECEYLVLFAWPIFVPYYLYRRLGRLGLLVGLGVAGLYFLPLVVAAVVYAFKQIAPH